MSRTLWGYEKGAKELIGDFERGGMARQEADRKIEKLESEELEVLIFFSIVLRIPNYFKHLIALIKQRAYSLDWSTNIGQVILTDQTEILDDILSLGIAINSRGHTGKNALFYAIFYQDAEATRKLLEKGADPNLKVRGTSLLEFAVDQAGDSLEIIATLFEHTKIPIDLNDYDDDKRGILRLAIDQGHVSLVEYLLNKGANLIQALRFHTGNPLKTLLNTKMGMYRVITEHLDKEKYMSYLIRDEPELFYIIQQKDMTQRIERIEILLGKGLDLNRADKTGMTALHMAIKMKDMEILSYLLGEWVDLGMLFEERPVMVYTIHCNNQDAIVPLLKAQADPYKECGRGCNAMQTALKLDRPKLLKELYSNGVALYNPNAFFPTCYFSVNMVPTDAMNQLIHILAVATSHGEILNRYDLMLLEERHPEFHRKYEELCEQFGFEDSESDHSVQIEEE